MKINTSRSLVLGAALLSTGTLLASISPVSAQPRPRHNPNGDTTQPNYRGDADSRDDQWRDGNDQSQNDRDDNDSNDRRDARHNRDSNSNGYGAQGGRNRDGRSNQGNDSNRPRFGQGQNNWNRPRNAGQNSHRPGNGYGQGNFGRPGYGRNGNYSGGSYSNTPRYNNGGNYGYGSNFGQSYTGRVTKVRSDQSFDAEIGGNTFNVYTLSRLPRGLSAGDAVRINGVQKYHNDIRDASVTVLRNR